MDKLIFPEHKHERIYPWILLAVFALVIAVKFNDLFLPFFWDELGVYGQGVAYQFHHGLSLLPRSLPDEISRGHPLWFTFIDAAVWKIFGESLFVAHGFSLLVALVLLISVFNKISYAYDSISALVACVFLAVQPLFLAQSSLVLPEMMLALLALLSLFSYYEKRFVRFALFASLAILTKESAMVLPVACLLFSLVQFILSKNIPAGFKLRNLAATLFPYLAFAVFLVIQKRQYGWYFFPYHYDMVQFSLNSFTGQFKAYFNFIFLAQGRYWIEILLILSFFFGLLTNRLSRINIAHSFITLLVIFMLFFLAFSSFFNFYLERYMLVMLVCASVLVGVGATSVIRNKAVVFCLCTFFCFIANSYWQSSEFHYDSDLGYRKQVRNLKQAVEYSAELAGAQDTITGYFPAYFALTFPDAGYLGKRKITAGDLYHPGNGLFVQNNLGDNRLPDGKKYTLNFIKEFKDDYAVSRVYRIEPLH